MKLSENDLIMILDPQEFKSVLDEVNTQMGTNLQTPQDLITFYDSVKGDVNYYGGCCLLFSAISQLCLMHKRNIIYRDYDLRAYNIVTSAIAEPIPQVASENMVVISALAPSNLTSITFTQDSALTITSQTNEYIDF